MRKIRQKFSKPMKPWEKQRIIDEKQLIKEYAYRNKSEIWKMKTKVDEFRNFAKKLVSIDNDQQLKERDEFLKGLYRRGLVEKDASIDDVLALTVRDISERRLQTMVFRKGLVNTPKQARQFIIHGHVFISDQKVTVPSKIVSREEEKDIRVVGVRVGGKK
ncbi:30S ribosomal protein S4 [archaeon]|nr:30S ribosomal protein S4 [archaeon]